MDLAEGPGAATGDDTAQERKTMRTTRREARRHPSLTHRRGRAPSPPTGRDGERGASLVEFAIVAPILFVMLFGIVDFGLVLSDSIGLRQGVREAARQASVAQFGSTSSCGASLTGNPTTEMRKLVCLTKARSDIDASKVRVAIRFDPASSGLAAAAAYPAGTGTPPVGNGIIVCSIVRMESRTGFFEPFLGDRYIKSKVVMRIEKAVGTAQTPVQEVDPSGQGWSWCTP